MSFKWQSCGETGKCYCVDCGSLLTGTDRRPRTLVMRLKYPGSRLYVCRECGCHNLVSRQAIPSVATAPPVRVGSRPTVSPEVRRRELEQRIERNRRVCLKLKTLIDSDSRLLKSLSEQRS